MDTTATSVFAAASQPRDPAQRHSLLKTIDCLLRDRVAIYERIRSDDDLLGLSRAMIATIVTGAAVFGASVGAYRGGVQILYGAIKFPIVLLLTAAVCAPTLSALNSAMGRPSNGRRDLALVVSALAMTALVLAAAAPVMMLGTPNFSAGSEGGTLISYHSMALMLFGCCTVAGLAGLGLFWRGLSASGRAGRFGVAGALIIVFVLVGAQMSWTFRPYLVRPRSPEPVFLRAHDLSLVEAVIQSGRSARGEFFRDEAPLPEGDTP
jgi:hypothetical protein